MVRGYFCSCSPVDDRHFCSSATEHSYHRRGQTGITTRPETLEGFVRKLDAPYGLNRGVE